MTELFISAFVTLFVVIDPVGVAPIFGGLTSGASAAQARAMAIRASLISAVILLLFAVLGQPLLGALGIGLDSFRIAGGIMLFLIALEMVFEKRTQRREQRAEKLREAHVEDVSVFPLAIPMIAGPGAIATVMLLMARARDGGETLVVLGALALVLALTAAALLAARPMMRLLGVRAEAGVTRLLGVILAALAAQYVVDGLKSAFA